MKLRIPDYVGIYAEGRARSLPGAAETTFDDIRVSCAEERGRLRVRLSAETSEPRYVRLRWNFSAEETRREPVRVLGDAWERGYGDMEWRGIAPERCMPWTCMVSNGSDATPGTAGRFTECFGVRVRPSAMCFWQYDGAGVTLWLDVRNGGCGVRLGGRTLDACEVVFAEYRDMTAFHAARAFYETLCDDPLRAGHKVYGSNNWYYAYGKSSSEEILRDARIVAELCDGLVNRPYMVIDDGWETYAVDGPWDRGNARFPDMRALADDIRAQGVRPGIWIRYLSDAHYGTEGVLPEHRLSRDGKYLDPSHPAVLERVRRDTRRIAGEWGYSLIKHDFSTYDIFGFWGFERPVTLAEDGWHFFDRTKTSAEIVKNFYRGIREAAGEDVVIVGCNVIGHLAAGLVESNRVGDDTSGREWERTRKYGVNTLAFRMAHNGAFYAADADCVGITGAIDWRENGAWLKALAVSGTPLFVSCMPGVPDAKETAELREAFARNSVQEDVLEPVDWMENTCPARWLCNGEEMRFDWFPQDGVGSFAP